MSPASIEDIPVASPRASPRLLVLFVTLSQGWEGQSVVTECFPPQSWEFLTPYLGTLMIRQRCAC